MSSVGQSSGSNSVPRTTGVFIATFACAAICATTEFAMAASKTTDRNAIPSCNSLADGTGIFDIMQTPVARYPEMDVRIPKQEKGFIHYGKQIGPFKPRLGKLTSVTLPGENEPSSMIATSRNGQIHYFLKEREENGQVIPAQESREPVYLEAPGEEIGVDDSVVFKSGQIGIIASNYDKRRMTYEDRFYLVEVDGTFRYFVVKAPNRRGSNRLSATKLPDDRILFSWLGNNESLFVAKSDGTAPVRVNLPAGLNLAQNGGLVTEPKYYPELNAVILRFERQTLVLNLDQELSGFVIDRSADSDVIVVGNKLVLVSSIGHDWGSGQRPSYQNTFAIYDSKGNFETEIRAKQHENLMGVEMVTDGKQPRLMGVFAHYNLDRREEVKPLRVRTWDLSGNELNDMEVPTTSSFPGAAGLEFPKHSRSARRLVLPNGKVVLQIVVQFERVAAKVETGTRELQAFVQTYVIDSKTTQASLMPSLTLRTSSIYSVPSGLSVVSPTRYLMEFQDADSNKLVAFFDSKTTHPVQILDLRGKSSPHSSISYWTDLGTDLNGRQLLGVNPQYYDGPTMVPVP